MELFTNAVDTHSCARLTAAQLAILSLNAVNFTVAGKSVYDERELVDFHVIAESYGQLTADPKPGNRKRSHAKFTLSESDELILLDQSPYVQLYNMDARREIRHFEQTHPEVLKTDALRHFILTLAHIARASQPKRLSGALEVGLHQIRYQCEGVQAAFSSPLQPHVDDEPFVGVILIDVAGIDGDLNYVCPGQRKRRRKSLSLVALKLRSPFDTLLLGERCMHGVGVMGSVNGKTAHRDILILTFTPLLAK